MIISIGAIDTELNKKVLRSTRELSSARIGYYLTEFINGATEQQGVIEMETYKYAYTSKDGFQYFVQATKDSAVSEMQMLLKHIMENSEKDLFDILITIDGVLFAGEGMCIDVQLIKTMDSQEEKIHNMMVENKNMEIRQREKAYRMAEFDARAGIPQTAQPAPAANKIEKSEKAVLIIIKEKLRVVIDVENYIKENHIAGEMNMVICDPDFQGVELEIRNLQGAFKPSPYLDKQALKKNVLRFEKSRGCNKNIPLLKWAEKSKKLPISIDYWNDEEDGKYLSIVGCTANRDIHNLVLSFNKEDITGVSVDGNSVAQPGPVKWAAGNLRKGKNATTEVKFFGFDNRGIFPIDASFTGTAVETTLSVEKIMLGGKSTDNFEVRHILEVESFKIVSE